MNTAPIYAVLLIDHDPNVRRDLGRALCDRGLDVRMAADGTEAAQAAREEQFDLILLEARMPPPGAATILGTLRNLPHTARTRVLLLASEGDGTDVEAAAREGAEAVLRKDELGPEGIAVEVSTLLAVDATAEQPRTVPPRHVASVPAAVDEIARRFRTGEIVPPAGAGRRTRPISTRPLRARPRDAVDTYRRQEQLRPRSMDEARSLGSTRFAPRPAAGAPRTTRTSGVEIVSREDCEKSEYDTLLNRFAGDAVQLIEQLGVPVDLVCTSCRERLVLRLRVDEEVRAGVRGHFVCGSCGRL